jgi:small subunit ribosomal protein S5
MINKEKKTFRKSAGREFKKDDDFDSKLLDLARVTRVTGGGKKLSFRATVVVGDKKGRIGVGISKGLDVSQSIDKATRAAKRNLIKVPIIDGTIPHEVTAKFGAARILLRPQRKGRGLVAGGTVRAICDLVGIKDISSKVLSKTKNKLNNARATIIALSSFRQARQTGKEKEKPAFVLKDFGEAKIELPEK